MANYYNSEWYQNLSDDIGEEYTDWDNFTKKQKRNAVKQIIEREAKAAATNPRWTNPYNLTQKQFSALGVSVNQSAISAANWEKQRLGDYYNNIPENDREWFKTVENKEVPKILDRETTKARDVYFSKDMSGRVESMRKRLQKQAKYINEGGTDKYGPSYSLETFKKAGIDINEDNYNKAVEYRDSFKSNRAWQNSSAQRNTGVETNPEKYTDEDIKKMRISREQEASIAEAKKWGIPDEKFYYSSPGRIENRMQTGERYKLRKERMPQFDTEKFQYIRPENIRELQSNPGYGKYLEAERGMQFEKKNGDGNTSNKAKWGKRAGFIGVGMATLTAAGLAVNSLMINDKGRMNNAQMYGQQPYSQY